jgi:hypothetical protein
MLLDEPFAGLDRRLREQVRGDVLRLLEATGAAVLLVTHDPEEAMALSDRIALMRRGRIEQQGTPSALYDRPATAFVARFLGETTAFEGVVRGGRVETPLGAVPATGLAEGATAEVHVRPEHVQILPRADEARGRVRGTLREVRLLGAVTALWVDVPDRNGIPTPVRLQFSDDQVTRSRKLEGQWWADGGAYFVSSFARQADGSPANHDGQVWLYDPDERTVTLKTIFGVNPIPNPAPTDPVYFDGPDNITVSPHGGLILAEDGVGRQHLIGVSRSGTAYPMARNQRNNSEFAGPSFSRDGRILFVNIYAGWTLAVTGPWQ